MNIPPKTIDVIVNIDAATLSPCPFCGANMTLD